MKIFWGMKILWISFGVITKYQKVNPKNGPGLRMFENIRVPPTPPPTPSLSHPGASMLGTNIEPTQQCRPFSHY